LNSHPNTEPKVSDPAWKLAWALSLTELISWGTLYYAFAVIVVPMERELGWSKTELNGALSVGLLVSGLLSLPVGAWIDRHGGRAVMTFGSLMGGAMLAAWAYVNDMTSFYLIWIGLGVALAMTLYEAAFAVVMANFSASFRKAITTITLAGGLASTVFIPLSQWLVEHIDWRTALLVLAACNIAINGGLHALMIPSKNRGAVPAAKAVPAMGQRAALGRVLKTPAFWALSICFTAYGAILSGLTFHIIPLLTERGVGTATIVACVAVIGPMQVVGRFALLLLGPRFTARHSGAFAMGAIIGAILFLLLAPTDAAWLVVFAALFGAGNGVMTIVRGTAVPDLLTKEHYGTINGAITLVFAIARALGPFAAAAAWTAAGNYTVVLWIMFAGACLTAISFLMAATAKKSTQER
jgi:MFS family permease